MNKLTFYKMCMGNIIQMHEAGMSTDGETLMWNMYKAIKTSNEEHRDVLMCGKCGTELNSENDYTCDCMK